MAAARPTATVLRRAPRLMPALGKGVLTGIGKRPRPDATLPGARLVQPAVRADPAKVAAYAQVCGFRADGTLPVTYPHITGFPLAARLMSARRFPLPLLGLVHTGIEIRQWDTLRVTDALELTVYAEELRAHRRGTEAVLITEARRDGVLVWCDRSSYLARHRVPEAHRATVETADGDGARPAGPPPHTTWQLAADLGRRHAAVSGDYNPIHLHPLTARPLGFPRAIAHGMWTFARCAADAVPPGAGPLRIGAEFRAPVLLPATVSYGRRDVAGSGSGGGSGTGGGCVFQLSGDGAGGGGAGRVHLDGWLEVGR
ncbi:MaoC family dehydratase [Streptomyces sp. NPDC048644]|uniref:MaoC family dehydratase n=1 Tax=Streptomyces sp. NPDC048644 TaxID=3365582 RepID=UPI0037203599